MGTKVARSYAINALGQFENLYVYRYHKKCLVHFGYIDDIFMLWTHTREDLIEFIDHLNTVCPRTECHFIRNKITGSNPCQTLLLNHAQVKV